MVEEEVESPADDLASFPGPHVVSLKDCGNLEGEQIKRQRSAPDP